MVFYHGTPIGGSEAEAKKFLRTRHGLVSYAYQQHMAIVADTCQSFVLDCGAWSIYQKGGQMDYEGYLKFCYKWHKHPGFDWAIIPDVIEGTENENDRYLDMWPDDIKGIPVYHNYMPIERLKKLGDKYGYVALGSSGQYFDLGSAKWWDRMSEMMDSICDENGRPAFKLHGLRMLDPKVFSQIPLSSADSTNAGRNNGQLDRFGQYCSPSAGTRAISIAERIEAFNSCPRWIKRAKQYDLFSELNFN